MMDELKELVILIEKLPNVAMWTLLGFAIYKLVTYLSVTGSFVFIAKLFIEKVHDAYRLKQTKNPIKEVEIKGQFIVQDGTYQRFMNEISMLKGDGPYIHGYHVDWLHDAIQDKYLKENGFPNCHYKKKYRNLAELTS
jgi:hypothetical protein